MLTSAAFGESPGASALPTAGAPYERWLLAVALAGQGRYRRSEEIAESLRDPRHPVALRAMAASLEASILRQQGEHGQALRRDRRALSLLDEPSPGEAAPELALARCDALTGLAADHIGLSQLNSSERLLEQAEGFVAAAESAPFGWRAQVRWAWVNAETAMAAGNTSAAARFGIARTGQFAAALPSLRHRIKSHLIIAAAHLCSAEAAPAQTHARAVLEEAEASGLFPLAWAAAMLLHALEPEAGWAGRAARFRQRWD